MAKFTVDQIKAAQATARSLKLKGWEQFCYLCADELVTICNGIGAESMPEKMRKALDALHPSLQIPAMIHDMRYHFGSGSKTDFSNANSDFAENGKTMAFHLYGWYNPRRYLAWHKACQFAEICEYFGWEAYKEAIDAREWAKI